MVVNVQLYMVRSFDHTKENHICSTYNSDGCKLMTNLVSKHALKGGTQLSALLSVIPIIIDRVFLLDIHIPAHQIQMCEHE